MADELKSNVKRSKRIIWLVIILLLILIIASLIYLFLTYYQPTPEPQPNINTILNEEPPAPESLPPELNSFNNPDADVVADVQGLNGQTEPAENDEAAAIVVAEAFAERFGSYSNQADYANLDDLEIFMTDSMYTWVQTYKEDLRANNPGFDTYYAVETQAVSTTVNNLDEEAGQAQILVKTQRQEFENTNNNPRVYYQDILLNLLKQDNQWLVNGAYWQ